MKRVIAKMGVTAFLFFLVKGLLWILIPAGIGMWAAFGDQEQTEASPTKTSWNGDSIDSE